jgi:hypothetical protein
VAWFDQVLADIGDGQSLAQSLSTFSGHMRRLRAVLAHATRRSLVLLDEARHPAGACHADPPETSLAEAALPRPASPSSPQSLLQKLQPRWAVAEKEALSHFVLDPSMCIYTE